MVEWVVPSTATRCRRHGEYEGCGDGTSAGPDGHPAGAGSAARDGGGRAKMFPASGRPRSTRRSAALVDLLGKLVEGVRRACDPHVVVMACRPALSAPPGLRVAGQGAAMSHGRAGLALGRFVGALSILPSGPRAAGSSGARPTCCLPTAATRCSLAHWLREVRLVDPLPPLEGTVWFGYPRGAWCSPCGIGGVTSRHDGRPRAAAHTHPRPWSTARLFPHLVHHPSLPDNHHMGAGEQRAAGSASGRTPSTTTPLSGADGDAVSVRLRGLIGALQRLTPAPCDERRCRGRRPALPPSAEV